MKDLKQNLKFIATLDLFLALLIVTQSHAQQVTPIRVAVKSGDNAQCYSSDVLEEIDAEIRLLFGTPEPATEQPTTQLPTPEPTEPPTTQLPTPEPTEPPTCTSSGSMPCTGAGWRRVVSLDMTDTSNSCPPGLSLTSFSRRTCGRTNSGEGCSSTTFNAGGSYSRVCGRIRAYQFGSTCGFWGYLRESQGIDGHYVNGVSLTHGPANARVHIWTFTSGLNENNNGQNAECQCPCDTTSSAAAAPPFIGNDYFCESGTQSWAHGRFFPDDVLWDGQNCMCPPSTCCQFNNPPWFTKTLPNPTTNNIELRLCSDDSASNDDAPIELIELYVQ